MGNTISTGVLIVAVGYCASLYVGRETDRHICEGQAFESDGVTYDRFDDAQLGMEFNDFGWAHFWVEDKNRFAYSLVYLDPQREMPWGVEGAVGYGYVADKPKGNSRTVSDGGLLDIPVVLAYDGLASFVTLEKVNAADGETIFYGFCRAID